MKAPVRHTMILASAGSGKTFALTNRFIELLASGAAPERIVALTFTRKAAGEFFDEILNKLARATLSPDHARALAREIGQPELGPREFLGFLRAMVEAMPRLNLSTLDAFFARIVQCFPLELGLAGDFEILQEHAARRARRRVLRSLFVTAGEADEAQKQFIEAFKRATFGTEEKQLSRRLDHFLDEYAETFLAAPLVALWGNVEAIWPDGCEWIRAIDRRDEAVATLRRELPWALLNGKQKERLDDFFAALPEYSPGGPLPAPIDYLLRNTFKIWDDLQAGRGEITLERRKVSLSPEAGQALVAVASGIVGAELQRRLEMTRGIFAVLHGYEQRYHEDVRRAGRLTFSDVQRLLMPHAGGPRLGTSAGHGGQDNESRLAIDWRLDAKFDHWLLDEFQDTSYGQWTILRNLIDEAVQDPEGRRSLLYVGDVKQAIYSWREGDPRLFREIFRHYNQADETVIAERHLTQSWRSCPAVVDTVNRVFGDDAALRAVVPGAAAEAWAAEWRDHASARPDVPGFAGLFEADGEAGRFAETLRILQEIEPLRRGLSTAVLVQKNDTGARLADYLRREGGIPAVAESDLHVCTDNPYTVALLALLRAAAHPGDTLAYEHVLMTPLAKLLAERKLNSRPALIRGLLGQIHEGGFASTLKDWMGGLEPYLGEGDEFTHERGRRLLEAARQVDETGSRDVAEFLEFAERYVVRDSEAGESVRILTIHKSKGLGFDVVILPDLQGSSLAERRRGLGVSKAADRSVRWILDLPGQDFAERDAVLGRYLESASADAAYEALCLLYVALTRAKRGLYVVTEPLAGSESRNYPRLLNLTLGAPFSAGQARWYEDVPLVAPEAGAGDAVKTIVPVLTRLRVVRHEARTPSGAEAASLPGAAVFTLHANRKAEFGTQVHALLATVRWSSPGVGQLTLALEPHADVGQFGPEAETYPPEVQAEVRACLQAPELADVFAPPASSRADVWRERPFEIILDHAWVTGVFDRVVIECGESGNPTRASVWDFKTDEVKDPSELPRVARRYETQLGLYRRVAARLLGLPEERVRAGLVFTHRRTAWPFDPTAPGSPQRS